MTATQQRQNISKSCPLPPPALPWGSGWEKVIHLDARLFNLGQTCYLNATLQALFHTTPFLKWLLQGGHKCKTKMCLTCHLKATVEGMAAALKTNSLHRPVILYALLRVLFKNMNLNLGKQEDAHEFFGHIIEQLSSEYFTEKGLGRTWEEERKSPMGCLWRGTYVSTCSCSRCVHTSSTYEPFYCLPLSITDDSVIDVDTALKSNFKVEAIEYKCTLCGNSKGNTKSFQILHPPNVLAISLKRFNSETNLKNKKKVPINYVLIVNKTEYILRSVVVHIGSSRVSGHYYTFSKCPYGSFAVFNDDEKIEHLPFLPPITDENGYLLIYESVTKDIQPIRSTPLLQKPVPVLSVATTYPKKPSVLKSTAIAKSKERALGCFKVTPFTVRCTEREVPKLIHSTPLKETDSVSRAAAPCPLSPAKESATPTRRKKEVGAFKVVHSPMKLTDTQGGKIQVMHSTPLKNMVSASRVVVPCPLSPVTKPASPNKRKGKDVGGFQVTPLKIIRTERQGSMTSSQSAHEYFIKTKEGIKSKVSPIKIIRQERAEKPTSTQSAHEYFIRPNNERCDKYPQTGKVHSDERIVTENGSCNDMQAPSLIEENDGPPDVMLNIVLHPGEIPGAILPKPIIEDNKVDALKRWLKCYGFPTNGTKPQLLKRVESVMALGKDKQVVPEIDDGKWYNQKLASHLGLVPSQQQAITFPKGGWQPFPSIQIPLNFNLGHMYYYLVESMPHVTESGNSPHNSDCDSAIEEDERLDLHDPSSEESIMNQDKKFRRGLAYLKSGHVGEVENYLSGSVYYVRSKVRASMELALYNVQVAISAVSGSIKSCTCQCKQRALGRCSHVSATLLYMWTHIKLHGYEAVTCTSRPCEWNKGSLTRNPGNVKEKIYQAYKIDVRRRQTFDPRATKFRLQSMTQSHINAFLAALSGGPVKTRFEYHLKIVHEDYTLGAKEMQRLIVYCRQFLKNQRFLVCKEIPPTLENPLHSYVYEELPPNVAFEVPGTGLQGTSDLWLGRRSVVIGASVSHRACHLTDMGVKGFLGSVLWNMNGDPTAAMKYGTRMEPLAREAYMKERVLIDDTATIRYNLGFHINSSFLAGGCSPDGIVNSKIYEDILLEIKCPFTLENIDPELFDSILNEKQMERFCIERDRNGIFQLKKGHKFYYQIQQSLGILNLKHADLVVYSKYGMIKASVKFDEGLYQEIVTKVTKFQRQHLIPEYFEKRVPRDLKPISLQY